MRKRLNIDPFEIVEFGGVTENQKAIVDLITEKGQITRAECQKTLGVRPQYAQNDLFFLYKLGVLGRTLGARR